MAEPIKVNAYYGICEFAVGDTTWHVLTDDKAVILARDDIVFCMDSEKQLYSLKYDKTNSFTSLDGKRLSLVMINTNRITIIREGGFVNANKKDATKI